MKKKKKNRWHSTIGDELISAGSRRNGFFFVFRTAALIEKKKWLPYTITATPRFDGRVIYYYIFVRKRFFPDKPGQFLNTKT